MMTDSLTELRLQPAQIQTTLTLTVTALLTELKSQQELILLRRTPMVTDTLTDRKLLRDQIQLILTAFPHSQHRSLITISKASHLLRLTAALMTILPQQVEQ
jgi:Glu-tRNA(Gln) amidotransferase subunit E-like FAD-binding protein